MSLFSNLEPVNSPALRTFNLPPETITEGTTYVFDSLPTYGAFIKAALLSNQSSNPIEYNIYYHRPGAPLLGKTDITLNGWFNRLYISSEETLNCIIHYELVKEYIARGGV